MKIAVTSQNFRTITPHAGKTRRFLVYEINTDGAPSEIGRIDLDKNMTIHEFGAREDAHPLDQMDVLITASAGAGFVQRLHSRGIQVVVTGETDPIQAIADLRNNRVRSPSPGSCNHHGHQCHEER